MKVKLLKYTKGGVELIAKSARVSGVPESIPEREVVRMIVENDYSSTLEHLYFTFDLQDISIALSRELLEHRIASHTARSTRYVEEANFGYFVPKEFQKNKKAMELYNGTIRQIANAYKELRSMKITRESARYLLPLAAYTNYVWTINARSLINFLGLRLCVRASPEIRELARQVHKIVTKIYPEIFKRTGCRGKNLAVCPENEVRGSPQGRLCPYKIKGSRAYIPTKRDVRERKKW